MCADAESTLAGVDIVSGIIAVVEDQAAFSDCHQLSSCSLDHHDGHGEHSDWDHECVRALIKAEKHKMLVVWTKGGWSNLFDHTKKKPSQHFLPILTVQYH